MPSDLLYKNGAGKTTFINLLLRLYEEYCGKILLNGKDIKDISLKLYRDMFSVVSQDIYLFNDTIENNILLGRKAFDNELEQVIKRCGLEEFISEHGLSYIVGENGGLLSGGEKQKIALARALIRDTPIIIFDEATSNLDQKTEKNLNHLIDSGLKDKIVIFVTHKIGIIKNSDKVIDLSKVENKR